MDGRAWLLQYGAEGEFGLEGIIITDYYNQYYMTLVRGILGGQSMPDGTVTAGTIFTNDILQDLNRYSEQNGNYGEFAWLMREAAHRILYTVVQSNAMNYIASDKSVQRLKPDWIKTLNLVSVITGVAAGLSAAGSVTLFIIPKKKKTI